MKATLKDGTVVEGTPEEVTAMLSAQASTPESATSEWRRIRAEHTDVPIERAISTGSDPRKSNATT